MVIGDRLKERISAAGFTHAELARRVGVKQPTITRLISGEQGGSKHLHQIAAILQTTPAYLTGEADDPGVGFVPAPSPEAIAVELGLVPVRELDLSLGMGATYLDVPVTEQIRHFDQNWLRQYTHASPEHLIFAQGVGDSMFPTLQDSDLLLIDCSQKVLNISDKIWAASYAGCGLVKRLRQIPNGVAMISDNPLVPDATAFDGELFLLGRVVAVIRKV